jgi:hypothetical protein
MADENEHIKNLLEAKARMVKMRREIARSLAQPYKRSEAERMQEPFVKLQALIEAIDHAIEDERLDEEESPALAGELDLE